MDKNELMHRRIEQGYYHPNMAGKDIKTAEGAQFYRAEGNRLHKQFDADVLELLGLTDHPKARTLMAIAWDLGHGNGYAEVWNIADNLADLLKD